MAIRDELKGWVVEALRRTAGSAQLVDIAKDVWQHREGELRRSGDLFYPWQHDMRWAGTRLGEGSPGAK